MAGVFFGAWRDDQAASVRWTPPSTYQRGYACFGNLSNMTDSRPHVIGETDDYCVLIAGYGHFDDVGGSTPMKTPVYAGGRDASAEGQPGAQAFFYDGAHVPALGVKYPIGTSVPGASVFRPLSWLTLPENHLAAIDDSELLVGHPDKQTKRSNLTASGSALGGFIPRSMALLNNGKIAIAFQCYDGSSYFIAITSEIDLLALPGSIQRDVTIYEFDGVDPWTAAAAGICAAYGSSVKKVQTHRCIYYWEKYVSTLAVNVTPGSATFYSPGDEMYSPNEDTPEYTNIRLGILSYALSGSYLTYSYTMDSIIFDADLALDGWSEVYPLASGSYTDSNQWSAPVIPLFWKNLVKARETA